MNASPPIQSPSFRFFYIWIGLVLHRVRETWRDGAIALGLPPHSRDHQFLVSLFGTEVPDSEIAARRGRSVAPKPLLDAMALWISNWQRSSLRGDGPRVDTLLRCFRAEGTASSALAELLDSGRVEVRRGCLHVVPVSEAPEAPPAPPAKPTGAKEGSSLDLPEGSRLWEAPEALMPFLLEALRGERPELPLRAPFRLLAAWLVFAGVCRFNRSTLKLVWADSAFGLGTVDRLERATCGVVETSTVRRRSAELLRDWRLPEASKGKEWNAWESLPDAWDQALCLHLLLGQADIGVQGWAVYTEPGGVGANNPQTWAEYLREIGASVPEDTCHATA